MRKVTLAILFFLAFIQVSTAQTSGGIGVSPTKLYYELQPGESKTVKLTVTNKSSKSEVFEASFSDWERDSIGNKMYYPINTRSNSCSNWVVAIPSLFELKANESKDILVKMIRPKDSTTSVAARNNKVRWTMLFVKQTSEKKSTEVNPKVMESRMNVEFRVGVHVYYTPYGLTKKDVDIIGFAKQPQVSTEAGEKNGRLLLKMKNIGDMITESDINVELINNKTGAEIKLKSQLVSMFPGSIRTVTIRLPDELEKGNYSATVIVNNGPMVELKIAEIDLRID